MTLTKHQMHAEILRHINEAGGVSQWSRLTGIDRSYVSLVKNKRREITEAMANACGYFSETQFRKGRG